MNLKVHEILAYAAFTLIVMWLIGWNILNAIMSTMIGFSLAGYIQVPFWLMLTTFFVIVIASCFTKHLYDKNIDLYDHNHIGPQNDTVTNRQHTNAQNPPRRIRGGVLERGNRRQGTAGGGGPTNRQGAAGGGGPTI
jgi:hypothetical protein